MRRPLARSHGNSARHGRAPQSLIPAAIEAPAMTSGKSPIDEAKAIVAIGAPRDRLRREVERV
jgi:hypothetical protein